MTGVTRNQTEFDKGRNITPALVQLYSMTSSEVSGSAGEEESWVASQVTPAAGLTRNLRAVM